MRSLAIDPALQLALRLALGAVLLQAAAHKLRDVAAFASAIAAYRLLPERRSRAAAAAFAVAELAIGCALLLPAAGPLPSVAAGALIAVYSLAVAVNLARGRREIDCGCAGPAARQPLRGGDLRAAGHLPIAPLDRRADDRRGHGGAVDRLRCRRDRALQRSPPRGAEDLT
jgi:uncharacterized membrane protein YphA (DoxX/SURF4 family)